MSSNVWSSWNSPPEACGQGASKTNMWMSEKCLLACCCKAATTGFTHAAISPGPLVRITVSTGLLLTAAVSSCAPLLQLDELMTASSSSSSSATLPFLVHPLLQPSGPPCEEVMCRDLRSLRACCWEFKNPLHGILDREIEENPGWLQKKWRTMRHLQSALCMVQQQPNGYAIVG